MTHTADAVADVLGVPVDMIAGDGLVERAAGDVTAATDGRRVDLRLVAWGDIAQDPTGYHSGV